MKIKKIKFYLLPSLFLGFYSCNSNDELQKNSPELSVHDKVVDVTHHDGHPFSTGITASVTGKYVANPDRGVMTQAFY